MTWKIEIRAWIGEEEEEDDGDGVGFGYCEQWSLNERVLGFRGRVGCNFEKLLGAELEESGMLEVGLMMQFVGCVSICGI